MKVIITLVADGPFDSALLPIIDHTLRRNPRVTEIDRNFALPHKLPPLREGLARRVQAALALYPANLLIVHRDAEREAMDTRRNEIERELKGLNALPPAWVAAIPVRMTEAWLLFDIAAIREAAGNPNGNMPLQLPRLQDIEAVPNPKKILHEALALASGRSGRALAKFNVSQAANRVAELIDNFAPLEALSAYRRFQSDLTTALDALGRSNTRINPAWRS